MPGRPRLRIGATATSTAGISAAAYGRRRAASATATVLSARCSGSGLPTSSISAASWPRRLLVEALTERRAPSADQISLDTLLVSLVDQHWLGSPRMAAPP